MSSHRVGAPAPYASPRVCPASTHEAIKRDLSRWLRETRPIGVRRYAAIQRSLDYRNCVYCDATLARRVS